MSKSDFFDYEKNLSNLIDSQSKIDIYKSPKKTYRKRSDNDLLRFDFDKGRLMLMNKYRNENQNPDNSITEGRKKRQYSHKIKRNNKIDLIIKDIEPKDETSESHSIYFKNYIQRTPNSKSVKNLNKYRYKKKKVTFKNKFVSIIDVENYKKYNVNEYLYNRNADAK